MYEFESLCTRAHLLLPTLVTRPLHSRLVSRPIRGRRAVRPLSLRALIADAIQQAAGDTRSLALTRGCSAVVDGAGGLAGAHRRHMAGGGGRLSRVVVWVGVGVLLLGRGGGGFGVEGGRLLLPGHGHDCPPSSSRVAVVVSAWGESDVGEE